MNCGSRSSVHDMSEMCNSGLGATWSRMMSKGYAWYVRGIRKGSLIFFRRPRELLVSGEGERSSIKDACILGKLVYRSAVPHLGVFQYRVRGRSFSFGHNRSPCTQAVFAAGGAEWSSSLTVWRLLVCLGVPAPCRRHDRVHAESQAARECCWVLGRAKSRWNQGMAYSTSNTVSSMEHLLTKLAIRKTG